MASPDRVRSIGYAVRHAHGPGCLRTGSVSQAPTVTESLPSELRS